MKYLLVLTADLGSYDDLARLVEALNVPNLPGVRPELRVAIDPTAQKVLDFLDEEKDG